MDDLVPMPALSTRHSRTVAPHSHAAVREVPWRPSPTQRTAPVTSSFVTEGPTPIGQQCEDAPWWGEACRPRGQARCKELSPRAQQPPKLSRATLRPCLSPGSSCWALPHRLLLGAGPLARSRGHRPCLLQLLSSFEAACVARGAEHSDCLAGRPPGTVPMPRPPGQHCWGVKGSGKPGGAGLTGLLKPPREGARRQEPQGPVQDKDRRLP